MRLHPARAAAGQPARTLSSFDAWLAHRRSKGNKDKEMRLIF